MAVELYDAGNGDGLFNLLGKAFHALNTLNTARLTTVPVEVQDVLAQFELLAAPTVDQQATITGLPSAITAWQSGGASLSSALQIYVQQYLIETVHADTPLSQKSLLVALKELIRQMVANVQSVDASAVAATVTAGSSNTGTGKLVVSTKRGDGKTQEHALAETLTGEITSDSSAAASLSIKGTVAASSLLGQDWPKGSAASTTLTAVVAGSSLVSNGDMEDEDDVADAPDDWIISVGTIGTHVKMTDVEVQTVAISGTPTAGTYLLHYTNLSGIVQTTDDIAFNASASAVQSALRELKGLESVEVSSSGTSPNLTHTITFEGAGGNQTQLTSTSRLDTGSIAHATTTAGTSQVYNGGKALRLVSDGSAQITLQQKISGLKPQTSYAPSAWFITNSVPAAGVITIDLINGIGGSVIADSEGVNNSLAFNANTLTTSWQHLSALIAGVFRMPLVVPDNVYLRIRQSTAVSNGSDVYIDDVALAEQRALYNGGPLASLFAGAVPFKNGDTFSLAVTNDRAGAVHEAMHRFCDLNALGLLLPSNASGLETVPDGVIA